MALWGGRFTQAADTRFKEFNDSLRFDYRLAEQDIVGSIACRQSCCVACQGDDHRDSHTEEGDGSGNNQDLAVDSLAVHRPEMRHQEPVSIKRRYAVVGVLCDHDARHGKEHNHIDDRDGNREHGLAAGTQRGDHACQKQGIARDHPKPDPAGKLETACFGLRRDVRLRCHLDFGQQIRKRLGGIEFMA